jgi:hypothetical protein
VERSKIARISQRIEQVAEVLGRKPRAFVYVDFPETDEQAVARYIARRPEHANAEFIFLRWGSAVTRARP